MIPLNLQKQCSNANLMLPLTQDQRWLLMFGGYGGGGKIFGETQLLDLDTLTWRVPSVCAMLGTLCVCHA